MATIDKQSVRAEFDKIKVGFDEQVKAGKVSTEVAMLVNTLMLLFNLVLSIFMEKSTKKTSANSSIPPSQTTPDNTSIMTKSKTGDDQNKQKTVTLPVFVNKDVALRLNFSSCQCTSILTHRIRGLSSVIAHAIRAFLLRQTYCHTLLI